MIFKNVYYISGECPQVMYFVLLHVSDCSNCIMDGYICLLVTCSSDSAILTLRTFSQYLSLSSYFNGTLFPSPSSLRYDELPSLNVHVHVWLALTNVDVSIVSKLAKDFTWQEIIREV